MTRYLDVCRFGTLSEYHRASLTPGLQRLALEAIRRTPRHLDWAITCGHRNQVDQDKAVRDGASKKPWPLSKHNSLPSRAFDVRPAGKFEPKDWNDRLRFSRIIGFIECVAFDIDVPVRLGIDFSGDGRSIDETFIDIPHIEEA
jgi:peptidoglycan L-alanyl-D-glutamate endopeptidase CwlK